MSDLIVVNPEQKAVEIFNPDNLPKILSAIEEEVTQFVPDLKTAGSRKEIASLAYKVSRSKTFLVDRGHELTSEWKAKAKVVDSQISHIKSRMDNLRDSVRKPLKEFEQKEVIRKKTITDKIDCYAKMGSRIFALSLDSEQIKQNLHFLNNEKIEKDSFFEFTEAALYQRSIAVESLEVVLKDVILREEEALELKKLREEANARKIKDHEEKMRIEAEKKAQEEAERKARVEIEKIEAEKRKLQAEKEASEQRAREFEAKAKLDAERAKEAAEREKKEAIELERKRQEYVQAAKDRELFLKQQRAKEEKEEAERNAKMLADKERLRVAQKEHISKVNKSIEIALVESSKITVSEAILIIQAMQYGLIPQVTINY